MQVRIEVSFDDPTPEREDDLRSLAFGLTNDRSGVRVLKREDDPQWLVVEFTMPTQAQYRAVEQIDRAIRFSLWQRLDSVIYFPRPPRARRSAPREHKSSAHQPREEQ